MCECLIPLFPVLRRVCRLCDKIVVRNMMSNCSNEILLLFLCRPFLIIKWNPDNKCFFFFCHLFQIRFIEQELQDVEVPIILVSHV